MFSRTRKLAKSTLDQEGREITHAQKRNRLSDPDTILHVRSRRDPNIITGANFNDDRLRDLWLVGGGSNFGILPIGQ